MTKMIDGGKSNFFYIYKLMSLESFERSHILSPAKKLLKSIWSFFP